MRKIVLILIGASIALFGDFTKSGDIIADNETILQWQDDTDAKTTKTWQQAIDYCEALTLGSYDDWRLPNINELTSLVDDTRYNPAIDPSFKNVVSGSYWSSTASARYTGRAWIVYFDGGVQSYHYLSNSDYVRCVRAGQ